MVQTIKQYEDDEEVMARCCHSLNLIFDSLYLKNDKKSLKLLNNHSKAFVQFLERYLLKKGGHPSAFLAAMKGMRLVF